MVLPVGLVFPGIGIVMTQHPEKPSQSLQDNTHDGKDDSPAFLSKQPRLTRDQREAIEVNIRRLRELLERKYWRNSSKK